MLYVAMRRYTRTSDNKTALRYEALLLRVFLHGDGRIEEFRSCRGVTRRRIEHIALLHSRTTALGLIKVRTIARTTVRADMLLFLYLLEVWNYHGIPRTNVKHNQYIAYSETRGW